MFVSKRRCIFCDYLSIKIVMPGLSQVNICYQDQNKNGIDRCMISMEVSRFSCVSCTLIDMTSRKNKEC